MQFNSYSYLFFLLVTVIAFWLLPVGYRRGYVLLVSIAFYASWNPYFVAIPFVICVIVYLSAQGMARKPATAGATFRCGVAAILIILAFFKYRGFVLQNLSLASFGPAMPQLAIAANLALPLGISFYSFEAISFLLDTRQRRVTSVGFMDLCLFIMFWPHLVAGPIVRVRELVPQLRFDREFDASQTISGLDRLLWGLIQKNVFANSLGGWVDDGFLPKAAALNSTIDTWALAIAFGLQIYFDFAAYSNMAIGAASLIGIRLPENFSYPYLAANPPDFWSRWHMTLSRWIRDYLFFPLSVRFSQSTIALYGSVIGAMALVGLWHGAAWGFIAWGIMHGVCLVVYRAYEQLRDRNFPKLAESRTIRLAWRVGTVIAVTAAWGPFRANSLCHAGTMV